MAFMKTLVLLSVFVAAASAVSTCPTAPGGTYYKIEPLPSSNLTATTQWTRPYTSVDIPVTYKIQHGTNYPEQVSLVPASPDMKYYTVTFHTPGRVETVGKLRYGTTSRVSISVSCSSHYYDIYPGTPAAYSSGYIYNCVIGPLAPATRYFYRIFTPAGNDYTFKFKSAPAPGANVRLALIADLGQTGNASSTYDNVITGQPDLVLMAGDLTYADNYGPENGNYPGPTGLLPCVAFNGTDVGTSGAIVGYSEVVTCGEGGLRWDSWGRLSEKLFASFPTSFVAGNHELETEPSYNWLTPFTSYSNRIPGHKSTAWVPGTSSKPSAPFYYSLNVGNVHVIGLSSYESFGKYTNQWYWVQDDLANVDRTMTPWIVVFLHAPWYNTDASHYLEGEPMRVALEKFLYTAKVDLVQAGHVHAYERSYPVYDYKLNPCGPTYVTVGDGGNDEGVAGPFLTVSVNGSSPAYSAFRDYYFGHAELKTLSHKVARYTWYRNVGTPKLASRQVGDRFDLVNKYNSGYC